MASPRCPAPACFCWVTKQVCLGPSNVCLAALFSQKKWAMHYRPYGIFAVCHKRVCCAHGACGCTSCFAVTLTSPSHMHVARTRQKKKKAQDAHCMACWSRLLLKSGAVLCFCEAIHCWWWGAQKWALVPGVWVYGLRSCVPIVVTTNQVAKGFAQHQPTHVLHCLAWVEYNHCWSAVLS